MNTYADKRKENINHSSANEPAQKQNNGEKTFQFVDNRPEAIAQRKLQEMANNSPQVKQVAQLQGTSDKVVQRAIDLSTLATTQNNQYYTLVGGGTKLISKAVAPAPEPTPLYNVENKRAINGDPLKIWKPRSKFADKKKLDKKTPVYDATNKLLQDVFEIEDTVLAELMNEVERDINNRQGDRGLRLGTAGLNDCKGYATTLQVMIAKYGKNPQGLVGKFWLHETQSGVANFPYHGATVVAQDGNDAVTLEAHAGQDLTAPLFHIRRGGKAGFENANKASYPNQYENTASESPLMSIQNAERVLEKLKVAWDDPFQRTDKSAVKESGAIPRDWKLIGGLLFAAIAAFAAVYQHTRGK